MKDDRVMPITVKMGLERLQVAVRESEMLEPYAQHEKRRTPRRHGILEMFTKPIGSRT